MELDVSRISLIYTKEIENRLIKLGYKIGPDKWILPPDWTYYKAKNINFGRIHYDNYGDKRVKLDNDGTIQIFNKPSVQEEIDELKQEIKKLKEQINESICLIWESIYDIRRKNQ